jgi:hypothetical protein
MPPTPEMCCVAIDDYPLHRRQMGKYPAQLIASKEQKQQKPPNNRRLL